MSKDLFIGLGTLCFAILYWFEADKIRISPLDGPVGASGLPKSLAYALAVLSFALIGRSLLRAAFPIPSTGEEAAPVALRERLYPHLRAIGMLAIGVAYLLIVPVLGYMPTIMLLLLAVALYMGGGVNLKSLAVAVLGGIFFQVLFVEFLDIPMPEGVLMGALTSSPN
jgi:putative tricarboxylic transport membrane protein